MKYLEIDFKLVTEMTLQKLVEKLKIVHKKLEWELLEDKKAIYGYVHEKGWYYEYYFNFETMKDIHMTISKDDDCIINRTCCLDFIRILEENGYICLLDDSSLLELMVMYDEIQYQKELIDQLFEQHDDVSRQIQIPILLKSNLEELYENEINDVILNVLEERVNELKKQPYVHRDCVLLEEILQYNPYISERKAQLERIKQVTKYKDSQRMVDELRKLGISIHQGDYMYCSFYDNPRYHFVLSSESDAYEQIKKYFY